MLRIYNTLTRQVEKFKPLSQDFLKVYYCGPTVYNYAHIGNMRAYLFEDAVVRSLRFLGYKVHTTMNITDIDDKTIRDSLASWEPLLEFTARYTAALLEDFVALSIILADIISPISRVIPEMIEIIQVLIDKGYAYVGPDNSVYYRVEKFKKYGELAALDMAGMRPGARVAKDEYAKDAVADFALWKAYDPSTDGDNKWEAAFMIDGVTRSIPGRPGWHIECSACNHKHFGAQIDIHMGGVDLVFPHHQNEIAQTEAFTGKQFSQYWIHCGHLLVEGKKMAKSAGNFYTLRDLYALLPKESPGMVARGLRLLSLTARYREDFNFKLESLEASIRTLGGLDRTLERLGRVVPVSSPVRNEVRDLLQIHMQEFVSALEDDINTPVALAQVHTLISDINKLIDEDRLSNWEQSAIIDMLRSFDAVLGVFDFNRLKSVVLPESLTLLLAERNTAKWARDYTRADELRAEILAQGYKIADTSTGSHLEKV